MRQPPGGSLHFIAGLDDPVRRALYEYVRDERRPVSRDEAALAVGVSRSSAAGHLDHLASAGLLDTEFRRLTGRQGPGAGRPAKLYCRARQDITVSLPPRSYDLAAELLATAVSESDASPGSARASVQRVATSRGAALGAEARSRVEGRKSRRGLVAAVVEVLAEQGYEPRTTNTGIVLANCPFHRLAKDHAELVCGMNHDLLAGFAAGLGEDVLTAVLDPGDERCCVRMALAAPQQKGS